MDDALLSRDRYACAVSAQDLTPYPRSRFAPLDVLGAAGMAGQRQGLGMLLQRLRADGSSTDRAMAEFDLARRLRDAVRKRAVRRDGMLTEDVAREALGWWINPTCTTCCGVRYVVARATGRTSGRQCPACEGSGQREAPGSDAARWVLAAIDQQVAQSEGAHRRAMR